MVYGVQLVKVGTIEFMKINYFIWLFALLGTLCCCPVFSADEQNQALSLVASYPVKVHDDIWSVKYALSNRGQTPVRFAMFTCSVWDNWKIDGKDFFIPVGGCRANILRECQLEAGKEVLGELNLQAIAKLTRGSHTFRLIFAPFSCESNAQKLLKLKTILSNEIKAVID